MLPLLPGGQTAVEERPAEAAICSRSRSSLPAISPIIIRRRLHALRKKSGVPKLPDFSASASGDVVVRGCRPGHAGIDLGTDAQPVDAERLDDRAGGFAASDDQLAHAALHQPDRDPRQRVLDQAAAPFGAELSLYRA